MDSKMINESINLLLGGVIASLFGFAFFYLLLSNKSNKKNSSDNDRTLISQARSDDDSLKLSENGECQPEVSGKTDVIIIGAGVAGSALACTLAKVLSISINRDFYTK